MIRIGEIIDKAAKYLPAEDVALIQKAYIYSAKAHQGQVRLSGEPYLSHPLEVANILTDLRLDAPSISAGLLHDTVEDTKATVDEVEDLFGEDVADIVDGVTKISQMNFHSKEAAQAENIRKMLLAMAEDIRVILVKLCDRLHNMRTLDFQKPLKQKLISQETLDIYAPLANRLGLGTLKTELEDLAFKYLKADEFNTIKEGLAHVVTFGEDYVAKVVDLLKDILEESSIKGRVFGRRKHIYSIHNKMAAQGLTLEQVPDVIAFRIIVSSIKDCYAVLGLVHSLWRPIPGRFKDYISMPKANMYQSLHTTVMGPGGERIEIQIRTEEMNRLAEYGVAAHWQYKEKGKKNYSVKDAERFSWLRQIMDWGRELADPREFVANLRFDLFQDEVFVFTPKGDVRELPEGATPVDFAYAIHTQVGYRCAGAKVNGRLVPLTTPLQSGDTVEIITDPNRHPSRDWLAFVKTAKARTRIRAHVRTEERGKAIALGQEMLEKESRKLGLNASKLHKDGSLQAVADDLTHGNMEELYSLIGYSKLTPKRLLRRFLPKPEEPKPGEAASKAAEQAQVQAQTQQEKAEAQAKSKAAEAIVISGVDDVLVRFAGCCTPLPGEPIVGYISRGRGVTVHTHDCPNIKGLEPDRLLTVSWQGDADRNYEANIHILAKNTAGALASIAQVMAADGVNISKGDFLSRVDGFTDLHFTVEVRDSAHLYKIMDLLRHLGQVHEVSRVSGQATEA